MKLKDCERKVYSQHGEDGVTEKLISLLYADPTDKRFVEIGTEAGIECNTRILRERYNWKGVMFDGGYENAAINLKRAFMTKDNVIQLLKESDVPQAFNFLSIDVDGNDFYLMLEIVKQHTLDIVVCEYNAIHPATDDKVIVYDENFRWDSTDYYGASLLSLQKLLTRFGYSLVHATSQGVNAFFVRTELIKSRGIEFDDLGDIEKLYIPVRYGVNNEGHQHDKLNRRWITSDAILTDSPVVQR